MRKIGFVISLLSSIAFICQEIVAIRLYGNTHNITQSLSVGAFYSVVVLIMFAITFIKDEEKEK